MRTTALTNEAVILHYTGIAFITAITCFGQTGCALETMKNARSDVLKNPELCKQSLAEGYPKPEYEVEGVVYSQNWIYKKTVYEKCFEAKIREKPQICKSVFAAGVPQISQGFSPPNQYELQRVHEYSACNTLARDIMNNVGSTSIVYDMNEESYSESEASYGKVHSVQVENLSRLGNNAGSAAGAAAGQIAYLEHNQLNNYNPWAQIGAGVLGAAIGSALDESPKVLYKITYWIKRNNGEFFSVEVFNRSPTHLPEGICVTLTENNSLSQAPQKKCK